MAVLQAIVDFSSVTLSATAGQKIVCISANRSGATTFGVTPNPTGSTWVNRLVTATLPANDEARRSLAIAELQVVSNFTSVNFTAAWNTGGASCVWLRLSEGYSFVSSVTANSGTSTVTAQSTGTTAALAAGNVLIITGVASRGGWTTRSWNTADIDPDVGGSPVVLVSDGANNEFSNACAAGYLSLLSQPSQTYTDQFNGSTARRMTAGLAAWVEPTGTARAMAGTANSVSRATGTLSRSSAVAATSNSAARATGSLASTLALAGTTDSAATAAGTLTTDPSLAGATSEASRAFADLQAERALAGASDSAANASGTLQSTLELTGTTDEASSATGTVSHIRAVAATTDVVSSGSGVLDLGTALAGAATSVGSGSGELQRTRDLTGSTTSADGASAILESELALTAVTDVSGWATGELSIAGQVDLVGGTRSAVSASGDLTGDLVLAGAATSAGSGSADLSVAGQVDLAGTTLIRSGGSGTLSGLVQFQATVNEADGATGQLTVSGDAKRDTMVLPIAENLLACLCEAVAEAPNPPASCCLRPGVTVAQGVSENEDECCDGLAWVRVVRVFPSGSEVGFPAINDDPAACSPPSYGIELEMGVYRCAPTGDHKTLPTCDEWTTATEQILDDAASMRRAWCCFRDNYENSAKLIGEWNPVTVQGGCTGGTLRIMIESYCADCVTDGS